MKIMTFWSQSSRNEWKEYFWHSRINTGHTTDGVSNSELSDGLTNRTCHRLIGFVVVYYKRAKRELKRVYGNGCRYNERLNTQTGGSKTPRTHWVTRVNIH
jgi:hypothetical protein